MRFRQYLAEIEATKRVGIIHFEKMKPYDFFMLAKEIVSQNKQLKNVKTSLKVDGLSARFGKDEHGKFFFESGRSGPIQTKKAFSEYTMSRGGNDEMVTRALHYDMIYDILEESDLWQEMPNNTKVICEILFNPMAEVIDDDGDKLKFVSIHYDRKRLGDTMTIVPIDVIGEYDLNDLYEKSNQDIKIVSPQLGNITMKLDIDMSGLDEMDPDVLTSLKHADRELKCEYISILQDIKDEIADQVLQYPIKGRDVIGDEVEGLVVELNGKTYKITTPAFKLSKSEERLARSPKK